MKILFTFLLAGLLGFCAPKSHAQSLPPGAIGTVNETTTMTYQNYSFSFTASSTGTDYFGLAFRQDPGYWSVGNFNLTTTGSATNLLQNPNLQYGGTVSSYGMTAPADWGVWYQSSAGAPPAAGFWAAPGAGWYGSYTGGLGVNTSTAGSWIDGAVGTYDGIYQGFSATAGATYTFSFTALGTNPYSNPSIMIGVYAGACAAGTTVFNCTPNSSSGLTAAMTPQATQGTGGAPTPPPAGPTVVNTVDSNQITTTTNGSTVYTYNQPITTTNWSDGTQTVANNGTATLISTTITGTSGGITTSQQSQVNSVTMPGFNNNIIYMNQSGNSDNINITQVGRGNRLDGATAAAAVISGGSNHITVRQGDPAAHTGNNLIDLYAIGGSNTLNLNQGTDSNGNATGLDQGGHYQYDYVNGTGNNLTVVQQNTAINAGQFSSVTINGNLNTVGITQTGNARNQLFASVTGNSNTVTTSQTGTSASYISVTTSGNGNSAVITQNNSNAVGANSATIVLNNNGAPASVNLTQTGGQSYSITQTCVTTCGTVTVRQ